MFFPSIQLSLKKKSLSLPTFSIFSYLYSTVFSLHYNIRDSYSFPSHPIISLPIAPIPAYHLSIIVYPCNFPHNLLSTTCSPLYNTVSPHQHLPHLYTLIHTSLHLSPLPHSLSHTRLPFNTEPLPTCSACIIYTSSLQHHSITCLHTLYTHHQHHPITYIV